MAGRLGRSRFLGGGLAGGCRHESLERSLGAAGSRGGLPVLKKHRCCRLHCCFEPYSGRALGHRVANIQVPTPLGSPRSREALPSGRGAAKFVAVWVRPTLAVDSMRFRDEATSDVSVCPQASGQGPHTLAPGQLGKGHGAELLGAVQAPHAAVAIVAGHDPREGLPGRVLHDLGEEGLATIHTQSMQAKTRRTVALRGAFGRKLAVIEHARSPPRGVQVSVSVRGSRGGRVSCRGQSANRAGEA